MDIIVCARSGGRAVGVKKSQSICGQREMGIVIILQAAHTGVSDMECTILLIVITQTRIALQQGKEDSA